MSYHIYIVIPVLSPSTALMWSLCIRCNALKKGVINLQRRRVILLRILNPIKFNITSDYLFFVRTVLVFQFLEYNILDKRRDDFKQGKYKKTRAQRLSRLSILALNEL